MIEIMRPDSLEGSNEPETVEEKITKIDELNLAIVDKWSNRSDLGVVEEFPQAVFIEGFKTKYPDINLEELEIYHKIVGSSPQRQHEFDTPDGLVFSEYSKFADEYLAQEDPVDDGLVA